MSSLAAPRTESTHYRLYEFAKTALIKIFVSPYATVCDLYCGAGVDTEKWDEAQIGHYVGIDASSSGISETREIWESQRKPYTADFFEVDPSVENLESLVQEKDISADIVCCLQHLQLCFETEDRARSLLRNVSSMLKPGGYFFGITPDSSTIWAKYQKNVEASHNKAGGMKPNVVPNCIRSESYMITFEVEEEKFPFFGKKYHLKFANDVASENQCLVHFPTLIRLAREVGLEYVEIQNLTEFYDDNRAQFAGMLLGAGPSFVDPRGRLLPRSFDVLGDAVTSRVPTLTYHKRPIFLSQFIYSPNFRISIVAGLYTTFIFQKPDPDIVPPIMTPTLEEESHIHEDEWQGSSWRHQVSIKDDEKKGHIEPAIGISDTIPEQAKGILGPGPADLRFSEPF